MGTVLSSRHALSELWYCLLDASEKPSRGVVFSSWAAVAFGNSTVQPVHDITCHFGSPALDIFVFFVTFRRNFEMLVLKFFFFFILKKEEVRCGIVLP
jgi:hypothetical protein